MPETLGDLLHKYDVFEYHIDDVRKSFMKVLADFRKAKCRHRAHLHHPSGNTVHTCHHPSFNDERDPDFICNFFNCPKMR